MRTDELIALLAQDARAAPRGLVGQRIGSAVVGGGLITLLLVVFWLGCQPLDGAARQPWFWMKMSYTGLLVAPAIGLAMRLGRPGGRLPIALVVIATVAVAMAGIAAVQLLGLPSGERLAAWLGNTWRVCSPLIFLLSLPIYAALVLALRSLAPTRLRAAGAGAGFLAGCVAATLYGLHCPEQGPAFVATWYSLGILAATALGAATGPRLLRW